MQTKMSTFSTLHEVAATLKQICVCIQHLFAALKVIHSAGRLIRKKVQISTKTIIFK